MIALVLLAALEPPDAATLKAIQEKTEKLRAALGESKDAERLVFLKAAEWIVTHGEWHPKQAKMTLDVLDEGLKRAENPVAWRDGAVNAGAYRSRIDGSIQPFLLTLPEGASKRKGLPLHVELHGRDGTLTEVKMLHRAIKGKAAKDLDHAVLEVYGRGNNAYRWSGETDVWEAMDAVTARLKNVDRKRLVLRGFSMGGAGAWHLGLHFPDSWAAVGPGAGFTTTKGYARGLKLTPTQEATLGIYDAVDCAENAFNVPFIAYSGADDPQKAAADNIEKALEKLGMKLTHLVAPKTKHIIPPEWQKKRLAELAKHERKTPDEIRFVTRTLRYNKCHWLTIERLEKHYAPTRIEAKRSGPEFKIKTENVRSFHLSGYAATWARKVTLIIDGKTVVVDPDPELEFARYGATFIKDEGKWLCGTPAPEEKKPGQQGPVDDAFMERFLCVRGVTFPAWNKAAHGHAEASFHRFREEWSKWMRGDLPFTRDVDPKPKDRTLILFGDPGSNVGIKAILPELPFKWTKDKITWRGKEYDAATHVPVMIRPRKGGGYLVLNSGHTFHADAFQGTNALLYPRLGDFALLRIKDAKKPLDVEVIDSGLFDERWQFPK